MRYGYRLCLPIATSPTRSLGHSTKPHAPLPKVSEQRLDVEVYVSHMGRSDAQSSSATSSPSHWYSVPTASYRERAYEDFVSDAGQAIEPLGLDLRRMIDERSGKAMLALVRETHLTR